MVHLTSFLALAAAAASCKAFLSIEDVTTAAELAPADVPSTESTMDGVDGGREPGECMSHESRLVSFDSTNGSKHLHKHKHTKTANETKFVCLVGWLVGWLFCGWLLNSPSGCKMKNEKWRIKNKMKNNK